MAKEERSLWEQLDSDVEPWRRGRLVLVLIALLNLVCQALVFAWGIVLGETEGLLWLVTVSVLFWLQFYLIWIGVHWIRWLAGASAGLTGFAYVIWGVRDGNLFEIAFGCIDLFIGAYLGLSPSVYFFAKHQQERRSWFHSLAVAAVFVVLFMTLFLGTVGLSAYRAQLENEACDFADDAFVRIFAHHDTYFFLEHMTEQALVAGGGRGQLTKFLQYTTLQAGDVHEIKRAAAQLRLTYSWPDKLGCTGSANAEGIGARGPVQLQLILIRSAQGWRIEDLSWRYHEYHPVLP